MQKLKLSKEKKKEKKDPEEKYDVNLGAVVKEVSDDLEEMEDEEM